MLGYVMRNRFTFLRLFAWAFGVQFVLYIVIVYFILAATSDGATDWFQKSIWMIYGRIGGLLFVSPWLFLPVRHRGHRELCGSVPAGRGFLSVYFACSAVTFPTHWQGRPSRAPWSRSLCWSWLLAPRALSRSEHDSHDRREPG